MKIISKSIKLKKANMSNIPNAIAFTFIRNWLSNKQYSKEREKYFIGSLSPKEVSNAMKEIKLLFKTYRDLDIITVEDKLGNITKIIL